MTENTWPRFEKVTQREICEPCWNQFHEKCWSKATPEEKLKDKTKKYLIPCNCACRDPRKKRVRLDKNLTRDIEEDFGTIEIK
jgi:hypothetical protein